MLNQEYFRLPLWVWLIIICVLIFSYSNTYKKPTIVDDSSNKNEQEKEKFASISKPKIKIYNFNTEWCGWSKKFQPEWDKFSENIKSNPKLTHVEAVDVKCDKSENESMCENYKVPGYPYVIIEVNDKRMPYNGERTALNLTQFISSL
jgi:thiol-disulfide isomerase/thioredoxin